MHDNEMQEIEIHIEHAKKAVAFGEAIDRLIRNKDFQTVIDQGYTTDEARRLTLLLGDPAVENKQPIMTSLQAIGELHQYLRMRLGVADQMRKDLEAYDAQVEADNEAEDAEGDA